MICKCGYECDPNKSSCCFLCSIGKGHGPSCISMKQNIPLMEIDKIFIINLKHRTDRKNQMIEEMQKQNIINYEFFDAIRPTIEEVNNWNTEFCYYVKPNVGLSRFPKISDRPVRLFEEPYRGL